MLTALNKSFFCAYLASVLFLIQPAFALETQAIANNEVIVEYEESLRAAAEEVVKMYPAVKQELENTFRTTIDFKPTIRIMKDRNTFQMASGNALVVAVAISGQDLVIIDNSKMRTHPFTLEVTLKHELCHLFLHHIVKPGHLPRWLNEGVSQWVSGGITEIIIGENKDLLRQAALTGRFLRLRNLTDRFPKENDPLLLAYQESKSIVDYIFQDFGSDGILRILEHLRDGNSSDAAILKSLAISMDDLEKDWHAHLSRRYTWFTYLSSHLYQVLFSFAALALFYGFIRVLLRKRAYKDEEDEDVGMPYE